MIVTAVPNTWRAFDSSGGSVHQAIGARPVLLPSKGAKVWECGELERFDRCFDTRPGDTAPQQISAALLDLCEKLR